MGGCARGCPKVINLSVVPTGGISNPFGVSSSCLYGTQSPRAGRPRVQHTRSSSSVLDPPTVRSMFSEALCFWEHRPHIDCISFWTRVKFWLRKALTGTQITHHKFNIFNTNEQTEYLTSSHNITFVIWWHHTELFPSSRAKCYLLKASSVCLNLIKHPSATKHKDFLLKEINKHLTT